MSLPLLDRTRRIANLLQNNSGTKVVFSDICSVLSDVLCANVLMISRKGKVLGLAMDESLPCLDRLVKHEVGSYADETFNERLLAILSTKENASLEVLGFTSDESQGCVALICPVIISGERMGTAFFYRKGMIFDVDDIILCEYGSTVISLEMLRAEMEEDAHEDRKQKRVASALASLSPSEREGITLILREMKTNGGAGIVVASRIAEESGLTRSTIVSAIKKLAGAGVLDAHSAGMRGTRISVRNTSVYQELGLD